MEAGTQFLTKYKIIDFNYVSVYYLTRTLKHPYEEEIKKL